MLHLQTILPNTLELLKRLSVQPEMQGMRLVGGTSLALQYGHRQSIDLDFFGQMKVSQEEILSMLERIGQYRLRNRTQNILQLIVEGIMVDIVDYSHYSWIDNPIVEDKIVLASPKDIAALKINAIEGRGSRKDFIDVHLLLQHYSLDELLAFYSQKYPNYSLFRALLSLTYFEDAETEAMPIMFMPTQWDTIKSDITQAVRNYQRQK
ncbi:MAG: nucleotidyl transferase AbiEii/AbiGii toxin family protein [Bacteroidales bacterium]|nr:nucleotidyl transferase AbiEii/AbiGii toxin family protein [Bacteroidales bacterium]